MKSRKSIIRRLVWVVPKSNLRTGSDLNAICQWLMDRLGCKEVTASEEQYNVKFHGIFKETKK